MPMPQIPGRRAMVAASGSLALMFSTASGTALAPPEPISAAGTPSAGSCAPPGGPGLNEGIPTPPGFVRTRGTVSALTLFIDFPGAEATGSTHQRFTEFFPATSAYFATSSYGRMRYEPKPVHRWLRMPRGFEEYGIDRGVGWHPQDTGGYNRLMRDIVAAAGPEVDFTAHDLVNILATPNAGPSALEKVLSVSFPGRPLVGTPTGPLQNISFIWSRQPGSPHRVLVHENGHLFGLPDLYWTGAGHPPPLTGHWDVMEQDWGPSNDLMAWHKWKLDWLTPDQVDCVLRPGTTEHLISPLGSDGGTKLVTVRTGPSQVLTLEVRAPSELDAAVCRIGVLVTRVDTGARTGEGPLRISDSTPGSPGCQRTPDPQVSPELTDAAYRPGETFRDNHSRVRVQVLSADDADRHRVRVTRW